MKARLTPRRLSWLGWFWGRVWFATKIAGVVAVVLGLLVWALAQGYVVESGLWAKGKLVAASGDMGLRIRDVTVEGRENLDARRLKTLIGAVPGDPILGVNLSALHDRLAAEPWVKTARVRRAWPDSLMIQIEERVPVAVWRDAPGGAAIIDTDGVVLAQEGLDEHGRLLAVEGNGADKEAGALIALLKGQPDIAVRVKSAARISERRWDLALEGGTILRLPEDDPGLALARASKAQAQENVLENGLKAVDLRQKDRIILESRPGDKRDLLLKSGNPV